MARGQRDRQKEQFWQRHVEAWRRSGRTVRDYCQAAGVVEHNFYSWKRVLAERQASAQPFEQPREKAKDDPLARLPAFVPVRLIEEQVASGGSVEVVLCGGRVVRVAPGFSADTLREVVAALETLPC
jgi:hypothetical protein